MTVHAVYGALLVAVLAGEYLVLRPAARHRLYTAVATPVRRRARCARRSLAALSRAAHLRPYRPIHTPRRRTHP